MIVGLQGTLSAIGPDWVHVAIGGVTLQVFVPPNTIAGLGPTGDTVSFHTLLRIRDEQPILYGFPDDASVQLFTMLTGVSGVGPRLGLALLSALDAASLQLAYCVGRCRRPSRRTRRGPPHRQPHHSGTSRQGGRHRKRRRGSGLRRRQRGHSGPGCPRLLGPPKRKPPPTPCRKRTARPSKTASA